MRTTAIGMVLVTLSSIGTALAEDANADVGEITLLPEIIVTADPAQRAPDDLVQPVTVISEESLRRLRSGVIGEVLSETPGVESASFGPGVGRPVIRGLQGSRVVVLEDGIRTMDVSAEGADHAIAVDPLNAEQIEIFRGPSTLLFGSGAAGGVVNVRTRRFSEQFSQGLSPVVDLSYGDNADERLGRVSLEYGVTPSLVVRGDYGARRTGDYEIPGFAEIDPDADARAGRLDNSNVSSDSRSATALHRGDYGHVGLSYSRYKTDYGVPEPLDPADIEFERIRAESDRVDLRAELLSPLTGLEAMRFKFAYSDFEQQEIEVEGPANDREQVTEAEFDNEEFEARLDARHVAIAGWSGVVGLQHNDRRFAALLEPEEGGEDFYVPPTDTTSTAVFAVEEKAFGFGRLQLGARVERLASDSRDLATRNFTPLSLSAGTIIDLDDAHHLRIGLTRAERAPSSEQLYANGRHAAAGTFEVGNPDFDVESFNNIEVGIDRHLGRLRYDATVFYNRADDFIFLDFEDDGTGNPVRVDDDGNRNVGGDNVLAVNRQDDADFYGAELSAEYDLLPAGPVTLAVQGSADFVRGSLRDGGDLPRITPARFGGGLVAGWQGWRASVNLRRTDSQDRIAIAETATGGYSLLSADLEYETRAPGLSITWYLRGRNLLDREARRHTSFLKDEVPQAGRSVFLGVRIAAGGRS